MSLSQNNSFVYRVQERTNLTGMISANNQSMQIGEDSRA